LEFLQYIVHAGCICFVGAQSGCYLGSSDWYFSITDNEMKEFNEGIFDKSVRPVIINSAKNLLIFPFFKLSKQVSQQRFRADHISQLFHTIPNNDTKFKPCLNQDKKQKAPIFWKPLFYWSG
jgi:hypothetical protein